MLFVKKERLILGEACIKEELSDSEGVILLKINLKCPEINAKKREPLSVFAKNFYSDLINSFAEYAKTELLKAAREKYSESTEGFLPFAAVMNYRVTRFDERFLSVVIDISVSDGAGNISHERKTQVWERSFGTKCRHTCLINDKVLDEYLLQSFSKKEIKRIDRELFALTDNGFELYIRRGSEYTFVCVPYEKIEAKF